LCLKVDYQRVRAGQLHVRISIERRARTSFAPCLLQSLIAVEKKSMLTAWASAA
jgi:hypothetical protein